jgi:hypothetical protein
MDWQHTPIEIDQMGLVRPGRSTRLSGVPGCL